MASKLKRLFSSSEAKEKEALAEAQRTTSSTSSSPPNYSNSTEQAPEYDEENTLSPPSLSAGFSNLNISEFSSDGLPQPVECIAHLKVLECFYRLKQTVGSHDRLFGINDSIVTSQSSVEGDRLAESLAKLAEKRWAIYLQRAVDRFETWWASVTPAASMISRTHLDTEIRKDRLLRPQYVETPRLNLTKDRIPPVDVLMVWHAYMLNPRAYLEDCVRYGRMSLWHTPMPWQAASDCVNSETFKYEAGSAAEEHFTSITGLPWNNLADPNSKGVDCPVCNSREWVPWTTCFENNFSRDLDMMLTVGRGFCDKDFAVYCKSCCELLTHDRLRAGKFCNDIKKLLKDDVPLGGTVLGDEGLPATPFEGHTSTHRKPAQLPNDLFKTGLGQTIINDHSWHKRERNNDSKKTVSDIRDAMEKAMADKEYMRRVRNSYSHKMLRPERIAIRKTMSRYWENSSPFALDLVGAVIRQGTFIEKMHNIDWLHSPALRNTMSRLIKKYTVFLCIMGGNPLHMAVPTLDVDLAWHTHQLSTYKYLRYTVSLTRQFVDHDDKVAETKLNDAFAWTSKQYQKMTGEPYSECTCWYCEAIRESHTSAASRLFNTTNSQAGDMLHNASQDPRKSVHISAHNAVRPIDGDLTYRTESRMKADELERQYQKACGRARRKGKPVPRRDDYYYSDAWGYPVYIPAYSPYVGFVPYAPMYYPVTPGCMAVGAGAVGNCCSGTCGGGVAAGGCGGPGGCAGGAAGGCGGGGGGGGCGGGGGGGGCGGGGG